MIVRIARLQRRIFSELINTQFGDFCNHIFRLLVGGRTNVGRGCASALNLGTRFGFRGCLFCADTSRVEPYARRVEPAR